MESRKLTDRQSPDAPRVWIGWKGNRKLSWPTFNLPAGRTCPNATAECKRRCYAAKAEALYLPVLPCRSANFTATKSSRRFVEEVCRQIDKRRRVPEIFRIHESGDFYSKRYFRCWVEIARRNPETRFFAFTKVFDLFDEERPSNLTLIASLFYDDDRKAPKGAPVFRTVRKGETAPGIRCAGNCDSCGVCPFAEDEVEIWTELH